MSDIAAAVPARLIGWASWAGSKDQSLASLASNLDTAIEAFNASPQSPHYITLPYVGNELASFAAHNAVIDAWVGKVGQAFKAAAGDATSPTGSKPWSELSPATLASLVGQLPTQTAADAGDGAALVEQLKEQKAQPGDGSMGSQNGLPASVRDQQNRQTLDQEIKLLEAAPPSPSRDQFLAAAEGVAKALAEAPPGVTSYLLGLNLAKGQAAVAYGDPDTAQNTAVYVPGVSASLAQMPDDGAIAYLYKQAHEYDPNASLSTIEWLGYAAPPNVAAATMPGAAEQGAQPLDQFMASLRQSHQGNPSNTTIVGHSYGSLVVGLAAKQTDEIANSIVLVGSPGAGVEQASQLNVAPGHVWAADNPLDWVPDGTAAITSQANPWLRMLGLPAQNLFGADPTDPLFGARHFSTGPITAGDEGSTPWIFHDYFAPGSQSLQNIARIIDGQDQ